MAVSTFALAEAFIRVRSEDSQAKLSIDSIRTKLSDLARQRATVSIDANDKAAVAKVAAFDVMLSRLQKRAQNNLGDLGLQSLASSVLKADAELGNLDNRFGVTSHAMQTHQRAVRLLADAEHVLAGETGNAAAAAEKAGFSFSQLGQYGMPALIGAGIAASPIIATVGTGLLGLGLAAKGLIGPVIAASQKTGGLAANMGSLDPVQRQAANSLLMLGQEYHGFSAALQPQVLSIWTRGLQLAGGVMGDLEPVAKATGNAVSTLLGQVDAEFRSGTWQNFFSWMAAHAGPDIRLLGDNFVTLIHALPTLVEDLQPLGVALLRITNAVGLAITGLANLGHLIEHPPKNSFGEKVIATFSWLENHLPAGHKTGLQLIQDWTHMGSAADRAAPKIQDSANAAQSLAYQAQQAAAKIQSVIDAMTGLEGNSVSALQAFHTLRGELKTTGASFTGVNTNSLTLQSTLATQLLPSMQSVVAQMKSAHAPTKDLAHYVGTLLAPAANNGALKNAALRQAIFTMAQEAGYTGPNKIKPLRDWIDRYATALKNVPKFVNTAVSAHGSGTGKITFAQQIAGQQAFGGFLEFHAAGGLIRGGKPGRDSVLAALMPGEVVVPTRMVNAGAVDHLRGRLPSFASGGLVPGFGSPFPTKGAPWMSQREAAFMGSALGSGIGAAVAQMRKAVQAAAAKAAAAAASAAAGPGGGSPAANAALARRMMPAWGSGAEWSAWNYVAMRESGWSQFARNPTSGAYGIPQALPFTKMPKAAWPASAGGSSNPRAQIGWMIGYIRGRYGDPISAAAHERAFSWYDNGGWLQPGLTLAMNGTGRPERVLGPHDGTPQAVNITVNVPPTVNPRVVGREVAELLTYHLKGGGRLFPHGYQLGVDSSGGRVVVS